jgi:hypothetical protein
MLQYISLGHDDAQSAIIAIKAEMISRGVVAVIAVADVHGEILGLLHLK